MTQEEKYNNYVGENPIYANLTFTTSEETSSAEKLHPLLVFTQMLIDKALTSNDSRLLIILPDDDCSIIPLLVSKCITEIVQNEYDYIDCFKSMPRGQKLRLGKAVIEFKELDPNGRIVFGVDRDEMIIREPLKNVFSYLEKCSGARSSFKTWYNEKNKFLSNLSGNALIAESRQKRNTNKTSILLLKQINNYDSIIKDLLVCNNPISKFLITAEIDSQENKGFKINTNGNIDCIPSLSVTPKLSRVYEQLKNHKEVVSSVVVDQDKFSELSSNPDLLKRCLKQDIPFIVFCSEANFESVPLLTGLGFQLWHWNPLTMQNSMFICEKKQTEKSAIFGNMTRKVNNASQASLIPLICNGSRLGQIFRIIKYITEEIPEPDSLMKQLVRQLWSFFRKNSSLIYTSDLIRNKFKGSLTEINELWEKQKSNYQGQRISSYFDDLFDLLKQEVEQRETEKQKQLVSYLEQLPSINKPLITVIVPDNYDFIDQTTSYYNSIQQTAIVNVIGISDFFYRQQEEYFFSDYLVVSWFEKSEYINIRRSYCYKSLVYLQYAFENAWRNSLVRKINECIPVGFSSQTATAAGIDDVSSGISFDDVVIPNDGASFVDNTDYTFSTGVIKYTLPSHSTHYDRDEEVECIPMLLSNDKIAFFFPTHDVIDVSSLLHFPNSNAQKKEARELEKGNMILVRESEKDIIREKADQMMNAKNEGYLREASEQWHQLLLAFSQKKPINEIAKLFEKNGSDCSPQVIRNWLDGDTICPRDIENLRLLAKITKNIPILKNMAMDFESKIDYIYGAGRKVQSYHQAAGRLLTTALRDKRKEILDISRRSPKRGKIEGIGDISIFTVEEILDVEAVPRLKVNKIEDLN